MDQDGCLPIKRPCPSSTECQRGSTTKKNADCVDKDDNAVPVANDNEGGDDVDKEYEGRKNGLVSSISSSSWIKIISAMYGPCEQSFVNTKAETIPFAAGASSSPSQVRRAENENDTAGGSTSSPYLRPGTRNCVPFVKALLMIAVSQEEGLTDEENEDLRVRTGALYRSKASIEREQKEVEDCGSSPPSPISDGIRVPSTVDGSSRTFICLLSGTGGEEGLSMNAVFGDPCPGTSKQLQITYTVTENGMTEIFHDTFAEHERVTVRRHLLLTTISRKRAANRIAIREGVDDGNGKSRRCVMDRHRNVTVHEASSRQLPSSTMDTNTFGVVLPRVFPYLDVQQRMECRQVCRTWKTIIAESGVATTIDATDRTIALPFLRGVLRYSYQSLQSLVLSGLKDLKKCDLHPSIPHLKVLRTLDLTQCRLLDDSTMELLSQHIYTTLQVLYLKGLRKVTDIGLMKICRSCTSLEVLDISHISSITDEGGTSINHLVKLRALFLRDNFHLTNRSLDDITKSCSKLSQLTLWGCIKMNHLDFCTKSFCEGSNLVILNLTGCYGLGDDAAESIGGMNHLNSLIVDECHRLSDTFFESLVVKSSCLPRLQHLHLRYLRLLTDSGVRLIARHMKELYSLDLSFCTKISCDGVYDLLETRHDSLSELCLKSCRNLEISVPRRGPDGRFPDQASGGTFDNHLRRFRPNRFDGQGDFSNTTIGRRNLATNAGHWILNSLRPRGVDHALCILDVRCCGGKSFDYRYNDTLDDFSTGMSALKFEQRVAGYFVRPVGPERRQRVVQRIYKSVRQAARARRTPSS